MSRWQWALIAIFLLVGAAGVVALVAEAGREAAGDYEKEPPGSPAEIRERAARCNEAPDELVRFIASGLRVADGKITEVAAVRSVDGERPWLIATRIQGDEFDELAVFSADELSESGNVFAVDRIAEEFSDWAVADGTEGSPELVLGDDGTDEALDCID
ncbi:MAG: hypothetical protein GEU88_05470 [Solirubrobacterales bacterium]|nr:hypothetical protein [Solirubrobacterales bacterium]